jgi:GR25 family glycosyltransferase involved in LPS biosynthesis
VWNLQNPTPPAWVRAGFDESKERERKKYLVDSTLDSLGLIEMDYFAGNVTSSWVSQIGPTYLVNLKSMPARLDHFRGELRKFGSPPFTRISYRPSWSQTRDWLEAAGAHDIADAKQKIRVGTERETLSKWRGALGCSRGHQKVIQEAYEKNITRVAVFEDDSKVVVPDFQRKVKSALDWLDEHEPTWCMFMPGYLEGYGEHRHPLANNPNISRLTHTVGTQGYIVHRRCVSKIVEHTRAGKLAGIPIDVYYVFNLQTLGNVYGFSQSAVSQYKTYSILLDCIRSAGDCITKSKRRK